MRPGVGTAFLALSVLAATVLRAQSPAAVDTIAEARRLRDAGEYSAAAALLAPYVAGHPEDPGTASMAALMAYWSKDFASARATYERALELHPNAADLRVEFARFLVETGDLSRARVVVTPLAETGPRLLPATRQAIGLLGTLDYWRGDFSGARKRFIEAVRLDSADTASRRQLREIEIVSAAWVRVGGSAWHDDQPLNRAGFQAEGGWFATPVTPLSVRVGSMQFSEDGLSESVSRAEATVATFFPGARLDVSIGGGVLSRTFGESPDWTGRTSLGVRWPRHLVLEGTFERAPYLNTTTSLATTVMTQTMDGTLRWRSPSGWMGDATARREAFEDDNTITTGFFWLLAPVVNRSRGMLQLGYGFSAQAAEHSRFVPDPDYLDFPPGQPPETVPGIYDPYHTPRDLRVHSALVGVTMRPSARWTLTGNGSWGFHARDDAPVLVVVPDPPNNSIVRTYYQRDFTPWNARVALEGSASESVRVAITAEHGTGPYYAFTTAGLRFTYAFVAAARRRADRY